MKYAIFITIFVMMTLMSRTEARSWTSRDGKTIEAEYVKVESGLVWLRGPNGREVSFPYNAFSGEDQEVIMSLYQEAQKKIEQEKAAANAAVLEKWKPGQVIKCVTPDKTSTSYHVYIPSSFDPEHPPPLVYAFSPGGSGRGQLNAMKSSAEKVGWIVVGCDKLKNGMDEKVENEIEDAILADVAARVPHDPKRIYLSGMSGGAMRCYQLTARRQDVEVVGIFACGGWLGGAEYQKKYDPPKGVSVAMINGDNDKGANAWVESDSKVLKKSRWSVKTFDFPGGHAMAPPPVLDEAVAWMLEQPHTR